MSFKDRNLIKNKTGKNNIEGMLIRKRIPLLVGTLIFISMVIASIFTYIVVKGDINEITQPVNQMTQRIFIIAVLVGIVSILAGIIASKLIVDPLTKVTLLVDKISKLDLSEDKDIEKLIKTNDEIGTIARAIVRMRKTLKNVVQNLILASENISSNERTVEELTKLLKVKAQKN